MNVSLTLWLVTIGAILVLVAMDFLTVSRKPHDVSFKEAAWWSIFYIGIAIAFGVVVWVMSGSDFGTQYFAAYLVEKSLSVDNLFVFVIILTQFAVPSIYHQRVLLFGVVLALVLRAIFIAIGAAALAAFAFTFVIFGAILIWTGIQLFRHRDADPEPKDNLVVRTFRRWYPVTEDYHGTKLFVKIDGKRLATPLLLVMVAIASTDLLFALDSIPATFGVTQEPYLVFTANAAALLGLRALYFLLRGLLDKLIYLSMGLSVILIFIGVKLILTFFHETYPVVPKIPTLFSLGVIAAILIVVTVASWLKVRKDPSARAHAGTITQPRPHDEDKGAS
ncbi:MAG: tellurium resistance protein TerC [Actinomycetales bacterium mxb001]|nr:MAG: tellurium resistance protein TerC [Actinomycetales bacterium mxb001]